MNKKLLSLMTFAAITAASSSYVSANSGTLTFNGTVSQAACTITGLDSTITFPTMSRAQIEAESSGARVGQVPFNINFTNCPASVAEAQIKFNYTVATAGTRRISLGSTTMRGASLVIQRTPQAGGSAGQIANGETVKVTLANQQGGLTLYPTMVKLSNETAAGTFSGTTDLVISYN